MTISTIYVSRRVDRGGDYWFAWAGTDLFSRIQAVADDRLEAVGRLVDIATRHRIPLSNSVSIDTNPPHIGWPYVA